LGNQFNLIRLLFLCCALFTLSSCNNKEADSTAALDKNQIIINDNANNTEQFAARIRTFLSILHNNPTLKNYQTAMGYSDYAELQFYLKECGEKNNIKAPLVNNKCHRAMIKNWQEKLSSTSHYLTWLAGKIPNIPL